LAYVSAKRYGAHGAVLTLLAPAAIALLVPGLSPVRAHLFTFAGIALLMLLTHADRAGGRGWVLPWLATWVLWVNLHGGVTLGYVLFGTYVLERFLEALRSGSSLSDAIRRHLHLLAVAGAMALALLANPYGWAYVPYLWNALSLERSLIGEWVPIWHETVMPALQLMYGFAMALAVYAVAKRRTLWLPGLPMLLLAAWVAFQHQRMTPVFAIVWFAFVPAYLSSTPLGTMLRGLGARIARPAAVVALVAGVVSLWMATQARFWDLRLPGPRDNHGWTAPAGAVDYLRSAGFRGNLMTPFAEGAYVSWELYPAVKVGMDSRYEAAYPTGALEENVALYSGEDGWEPMLTRTGAAAVLVPIEAGLERMIAANATWEPVYRDAGHVIYVRRPASFRVGRTSIDQVREQRDRRTAAAPVVQEFDCADQEKCLMP
jgi:hypothetical protein